MMMFIVWFFQSRENSWCTICRI